MLHAQHRAESLGITDLPDGMLFDDCKHAAALSPLAKFREAAQSELVAMAGCSFAEIRESKPSAPLVDMWRSDLHTWLAEQDQDADALTHVIQGMSPYV